MKIEDKILLAQQQLKLHNIDGWLIYDFQGRNDLGHTILCIPENIHSTRRFFYWIPKEGEPVKIVHQIEMHVLNHLPGEKIIYLTWKEFQERLKNLLAKKKTVAMEYSPYCHLPYLSKIDAGTVELVKECGVEVVSSATFIQYFTSTLDDKKYASHKEAMKFLEETFKEAWEFIRANLNRHITEMDVQNFFISKMNEKGFQTEGLPIVAANEHSADPHFVVSSENKKVLQKGDFVLLDFAVKKKENHSIFADITQIGVLDFSPSQRLQTLFQHVREARDTAFHLIETRYRKNEIVKGFEVDEVCRNVIKEYGFEEFFLHRTGHNIDHRTHGSGAHLDNFETMDERPLIPRTCFSIEPGIYLPGEFGMRLEYDVFIHDTGKCEITGNKQEELICVFQ